MRLLVTGGRAINASDREMLLSALDFFRSSATIEVVIHGYCFHPIEQVPRTHFSADMVADEWAERYGVPLLRYPVQKSIDGPWPGAGPRRNQRMVRVSQPTYGLAAIGGRGTESCKKFLREALVPYWDLAENKEWKP